MAYGIAGTDAGGVSHPGTSTCLDNVLDCRYGGMRYGLKERRNPTPP